MTTDTLKIGILKSHKIITKASNTNENCKIFEGEKSLYFTSTVSKSYTVTVLQCHSVRETKLTYFHDRSRIRKPSERGLAGSLTSPGDLRNGEHREHVVVVEGHDVLTHS